MVFFYVAYFTLEALFGVAWWTVTKTTNGVYYIIYGNSDDKDKVDGKIKLSDKEVSINKEILEKLLKNHETQQIEIKKLNEKIEVLTDYIKNQSSNQKKL